MSKQLILRVLMTVALCVVFAVPVVLIVFLLAWVDAAWWLWAVMVGSLALAATGLGEDARKILRYRRGQNDGADKVY